MSGMSEPNFFLRFIEASGSGSTILGVTAIVRLSDSVSILVAVIFPADH